MTDLNKKKSSVPFAFSKKNYQLMGVGLAILMVGFIVMGMDTEQHGFGFMGLTLGPIMVMLGFLFQFWAIMHRSKKA